MTTLPAPFELLLVGGAVRDEIMGKRPKDRDFVIVPSSDVLAEYHEKIDGGCDATAATLEAFEFSCQWLEQAHGVKFWKKDPPFVTARGHFPETHALFPGMDCDFRMARTEGAYSDGRHPDWVHLGTLEDDLATRDLRCNAIARRLDTGWLVDPYNGRADILNMTLRFVGVPEQRLREDALRVMGVLRFAVCKGFFIPADTQAVLDDPLTAEMLANLVRVPVERKRDELAPMLKHDTLGTLDLLAGLKPALREAIFHGGLRLAPDLKK